MLSSHLAWLWMRSHVLVHLEEVVALDLADVADKQLVRSPRLLVYYVDPPVARLRLLRWLEGRCRLAVPFLVGPCLLIGAHSLSHRGLGGALEGALSHWLAHGALSIDFLLLSTFRALRHHYMGRQRLAEILVLF